MLGLAHPATVLGSISPDSPMLGPPLAKLALPVPPQGTFEIQWPYM
jgi:hypothetical protein